MASVSTLRELRERGFSLHEGGELGEAELAYRELLRRSPNDLEVMHALGILATQQGRYGEAVELLTPVARAQESAPAHSDLGNAYLGMSRLEDALASYDRALALDPTLAGTLLNRGHALRSAGRDPDALESYAGACAAWPQFFEAHLGRAELLLERERLDEAVAAYDQALALEPRHAEARLGRAAALLRSRRYVEALADYDGIIALEPTSAPAHLGRGSALLGLGRAEEALRSCRQAIELSSGYAEAHMGCGLALKALKEPRAALDCYDRAIAVRPDYAEAFFNRGNLLAELAQPHAAIESYDRAIASRPGFAAAHFNRGNVYRELRQWDAALASYDHAIASTAGEYPEAHCNRALVLRELNNHEEALESYERALTLRPDCAEAYLGRGNLFYELTRVNEALASYDAAIAHRADPAETLFNRSLAHLLAGDFEKGWRDFEWRWSNRWGRAMRSVRRFAEPPWLGESSLAGKTILLHAEQGLGDTLQFCRFATLVAELGARVILEVPASLRSLLTSLDGVARVVASDEALPAFDCYCPLMSLPLALKTTLSSIPAQIPYLRSSAERLRDWQARLGPRTRPRVGLAWSGGFRQDQPELRSINNRRNMALATLRPLRHPGIEFYSLQKGEPAESELAATVAQGWDGPEINDLTSELTDFAETAALIEHLDLVISVDTSIAHLAGALGKPVWIMNRFDTCWRWLLERADSPWYPTARLYRQEQRGDWEGVVERIKRDLEEFEARAF